MIVVVITFLYFIAELGTAVYSKCLALEADSFHMLSDVLALLTGHYAAEYARLPSTDKATYGWSRTEVVGALANCVFLLGIIVEIFLAALERLVGFAHGSIEEKLAEDTTLVLWVGAAGLVVNLISLLIFTMAGDGGHHHHHHHGHSHGHSHGHGEHGKEDGHGCSKKHVVNGMIEVDSVMSLDDLARMETGAAYGAHHHHNHHHPPHHHHTGPVHEHKEADYGHYHDSSYDAKVDSHEHSGHCHDHHDHSGHGHSHKIDSSKQTESQRQLTGHELNIKGKERSIAMRTAPGRTSKNERVDDVILTSGQL